MQMVKYFDKITWGYWPSKESHYTLSIRDDIFQHANQYSIIQPKLDKIDRSFNQLSVLSCNASE
jgi:hypothetical protein